ncbi:MAG: hypothetical protein CL920_10850 [Deltaproteobacteria bacterium]|nr:hypothetical protein [Deltaproteobacteria bacterium]
MEKKHKEESGTEVVAQEEERAFSELSEEEQMRILDERDGPELDVEQVANSPEERHDIDDMMNEIWGDREGTFPPMVRYVAYTLMGISVLALGLLTIVSTQELGFATRIYGPSELVPGSMASYRIALFAPDKNSFLERIEGKIWLSQGKQRTLVYEGKTSAEVLLANIIVPKWKPGVPAQLLVDVKGPRGKDSLKVKVALRRPKNIRPHYKKETQRHLWTFAPEKDDPFKVEVFSEGRAFVSDLPNWVLMRVWERPVKKAAPKPTSKPAVAASKSTSQPTTVSTKAKPTTRAVRRVGLRAWKQGKTGASAKPIDIFAKNSADTDDKTKQWLPLQNPVLLKLFQGKGPWNQGMPVFSVGKQITTVRSIKIKRNVSFASAKRSEYKILGPYKSDEWGFIRFPYVPQFFQVQWGVQLTSGKYVSELPLAIKTDGYQLSMELQTVLLPESPSGKQTLSLSVDTLLRKGDLHVDLVQYGQRLFSRKYSIKGGKSQIDLTIPSTIKGLCSVQVYTEFFFPGEVYDARLVYIGKPNKAKILKQLQKHLVHRGDGMRILDLDPFRQHKVRPERMEAWSRRLFAFSKARFVAPLLLHDSTKKRLRQLRVFQGKFRARTLLFLGGLGGIVILGMLGSMLWGYRRDQIAIRRAAEEDLGELESRGFFMIVLAFLIIAMIFATILYLFWAIKWTYDFI